MGRSSDIAGFLSDELRLIKDTETSLRDLLKILETSRADGREGGRLLELEESILRL